MLTGLWVSTKKPNVDLFFEPFIQELKNLHRDGFRCQPPGFNEPITIKVHTLLSPVDSIQKPCLQNLHQFNGKYGYFGCLSPGKEIPFGRGKTRIYCNGLTEARTQKLLKEMQ